MLKRAVMIALHRASLTVGSNPCRNSHVSSIPSAVGVKLVSNF
jgi:hypothetical protein